MIVGVETLMAMEEFMGKDPELLAMNLDAVESLVRSYTNNNFQNRNMRMEAISKDGVLIGHTPFFIVGDTVQISQSPLNDGLYVIKDIKGCSIRLNKGLHDAIFNLITKIVYPSDVKKGVIDLMLWERENRQKVGIKSETLSRRSVTYYDQDASNQVMGYPVSLLGFLKPYMKARF